MSNLYSISRRKFIGNLSTAALTTAISGKVFGSISHAETKPQESILASSKKDSQSWIPDRRPIAVIRCFAGIFEGRNGNKYGLTPFWLKGGVSWLEEELERLYKVGYRRFMINLPAGREKPPAGVKVPWASAQWQVLDDANIHTTTTGSVKQDFENLITPWLATHPDVQLLFYIGFLVKSAYDRDMDGAFIPDPNNPTHLEIVKANTDGFINLSSNKKNSQVGFRLDHSATPENRSGLVALSEWFASNKLVSVGGEAIPTEADKSGYLMPMPAFINKCPWLALHIVHRQRDPRRLWQFDPATTEVGVGLRKDTFEGLSLAQSTEILEDYHRRGCVFYVYGRAENPFDWEPLVLDTTS